MVQVSRRPGPTGRTARASRTGVSGSTLIRLLARLADAGVPESRQAFADRLGQWVSWTDAIRLSGALNGGPAATPSGVRGSASTEEGECTRVRAALVNAIAEDSAPMDPTAAFSTYRRRYLARQQAMEAAIGPLRDRLRSRLAAGSPAMARLAAVDGVMEQVLGVQEHRLLSTIPVLLEKYFERLRRADEVPDEPDGMVQPRGWLEVFRNDVQGVLLAELDIRFQPVDGLLEALRMSQPGPND
ncbi:MAG: DUF3348 domain-containing protein [Variovorax sp.]|nr:MAG: DUF3348 domain-containing protein [Variovorax sp.]